MMADNMFTAPPSPEEQEALAKMGEQSAVPEQANSLMAPASPEEQQALQQQQGASPQGAAPMASESDRIAADANGVPITKSAFMDKVDIMNRGFDQYAIGGMQLLNEGVKALSGGRLDASGALSAANQRSQMRRDEAYARTPSPGAEILGQIGGATIASAPALMATTGAGALGVARAIGQGAASGGMAGVMDVADTGEDHLRAGVKGAAIGGALSGGVAAVGAMARTLFPKIGVSSFVKKVFQPKAAAVEDIASNISTDAGGIKQGLAKVNKIVQEGTQGRTPGEAIPGMLTRAKELSLVADDADKAAVAAQNLQTQNLGKKGIYEAVAGMSSPKTKALQKSSFDTIKNEFISPDGKLSTAPLKAEVRSIYGNVTASKEYIPDFIKENATLAQRYKIASKTFSEKPNSVAQMHKIKDMLDTEIDSLEPMGKIIMNNKPVSPEDLQQLHQLKAANLKIKSVLSQSDAYNAAMKTTQKIKIRENYENIIRDKGVKAGQSGKLSLEELHTSMFDDSHKMRQFVKDVRTTGGDPAQARKIIQLSDSLRQSPLARVMKRINEGESTVAVYGRDVGIVHRFLNKITIDRYRKALLDITLSGDKWAKDVSSVLDTKGQLPQAEKLYKLVMKVGAQGTAAAASGKAASKDEE